MDPTNAQNREGPAGVSPATRSAPRVSVCIPTYNGARYLGETIDSVLAQEFADYELVICDNRSTDETSALCARYSDPRIRYRRFEEFVGQAENWNRCLDEARGEYVIVLHADDVILPRFLARTTAVLDEHPEIGMVHCAVTYVDGAGTPFATNLPWGEDRLHTQEELLRRLLLEGCIVNPSGVLVRRSVYETVGHFTEEILWSVDWHMWIRIALHAQTAYLAEPLALYREHSSNLTWQVMNTACNGRDEIWMMRDIFSRVPTERADVRRLRSAAIRGVAHRTWCFAERQCRAGQQRSARIGLWRAASIDPRMLLQVRYWALWMATFLGYSAFERVRGGKQRIGSATQAAG